MSSVASIILFAVSVFIGSLIGFTAGETKGKPVDKNTENNIMVAGFALVLFFGLAVALQVSS